MPARLYHYDVFLRTSRGTVKRAVSQSTRDVRLAGETARNDVQRTLREAVQIVDVVPLRKTVGASKTVGRGKKQMTVTKIKVTQSRRPKARASAILSKKGRVFSTGEDKETVTHFVSVTDKMRDVRPKNLPGVCESEACIKRGSCNHEGLKVKRNRFLVYTTQVETIKAPGKRARKVVKRGLSWVIEPSVKTRAQASAWVTERFEAAGFESVVVLDCFTERQADREGYSKSPRSYFPDSSPRDTIRRVL